MITVRPMREGDQEAVEAIHARMGVDYQMPDLAEGDFVQVVEQDGKVIGASMNRVVAESYMWLEPGLLPHDKMNAIRLGERGMVLEARKRGWRELIAMIPDSVVLKFRKRLTQLQWAAHRTGWSLWSREVTHG